MYFRALMRVYFRALLRVYFRALLRALLRVPLHEPRAPPLPTNTTSTPLVTNMHRFCANRVSLSRNGIWTPAFAR